VNRYVALLRGINVGTAKRLAMGELREVFEQSGASNVRTLLQSGNVVFDAAAPLDATALTKAIEARTEVNARVQLLTASQFRAIAEANPLREVATNPSWMQVTFLTSPVDPSISPFTAEELAPEVLVFGKDALYQWTPDGTLKTKLPASFARALAPVGTSRNLNTVDKLVAMLDA
jgi:uncharacterized protein (DUF1697 family)